jgi:hypothetical protein
MRYVLALLLAALVLFAGCQAAAPVQQPAVESPEESDLESMVVEDEDLDELDLWFDESVFEY